VKQLDSLSALEDYGLGTQAAILKLGLQALGTYEDQESHDAACHVGIAMTIALLLRGTRHHARRQKLYIPKDIASTYKLSPGSVAKGEPTQALSKCVYEMAMLAKEHLDLAAAKKIPPESLPALYPAAIPRLVIAKLETVQYDIMHPDWNSMSSFMKLRLPLLLLQNRMLGKF